MTDRIPQDTNYEVRETAEFRDWLDNLRDRQARKRIDTRIFRLSTGNPGDVKRISGSVSELRIPYGPGYRVYFTWKGKVLLLLLAGGDKRTQKQDIELAKRLAGMRWENTDERNG